MKIKELIKVMQRIENQEAEILVSSDEELNQLFQKYQLADLGDGRFVIYGLTGSEVEE